MAGLQKEIVYWRVFTHSFDPYKSGLTPTTVGYQNFHPLGTGIKYVTEAFEIAQDHWKWSAPEGRPLEFHSIIDPRLIAAFAPTGVIYQIEWDYPIGMNVSEFLEHIRQRHPYL
jgi:hypothetical protein